MAIPTIEESQRGYAEGTRAKAGIWESRAAGAAADWERSAKSAEAEEAYAIGVRNAADNRLRQRGLTDVTATDFASAVRGKSGAYAQGTAAATGKWGRKFSPYLDRIRDVAPRLGARVPGDVSGNIDRRVKPIAQELHNMKMGGAGATVASIGYGAGGAIAAAPGGQRYYR